MKKEFLKHLEEAKAIPSLHKLGQSAVSKLTATKIKFKSYPTSDRHVKIVAMLGNVEIGSVNVTDDGVSEYGSHIGFSISDPRGLFTNGTVLDIVRVPFKI